MFVIPNVVTKEAYADLLEHYESLDNAIRDMLDYTVGWHGGSHEPRDCLAVIRSIGEAAIENHGQQRLSG